MESRIADLEIKLSYTEDLVEELNRQLFRQQQQIEVLQQAIRHLHQQMQSNAGPEEFKSLRDELPPHY